MVLSNGMEDHCPSPLGASTVPPGRLPCTRATVADLAEEVGRAFIHGRSQGSGDDDAVAARSDVKRYLVLLRGINVGGRNKVPMARLRELLEELGYTSVSTYIASGNVLLSSDRPAAEVRRQIEDALPKAFRLDSEIVAVHVLSRAQLRAVVENKPPAFGDRPDTYHSDTIFLMDIDAKKAMQVFDPRPGVDEVWPGKGVIYSQRLSAERTRSRLGRIVGTPAYKSMTIRSWQTTLALLERIDPAPG